MPAKPYEISRGDPFKPEIALTFDGGSRGQGSIQEIVSLLSSHEIKATMFLTGSFISGNPAEVKLLGDGGHEIANHTFSHPWLSDEESWKTLPGVTRSFFTEEIRKADQIYLQTTGRSLSNLWRAPYGARNSEVLSWASAMGMRHVFWTYDTADWRVDPADPLSRPGPVIINELETIASTASTGLNGYIILLHLGAKRTKDPLLPLLTGFISRMKNAGYSFVTVSQMLEHSADAFQTGDIPIPSTAEHIPLSPELLQVGLSEGYYSDTWLAPFFSTVLETAGEKAAIEISLMTPAFLTTPLSFSILINEQVVCQAEALPGKPIGLPIEITEKKFRLTIQSEDSFVPFLFGLNQDKRHLSMMLLNIS